MTRGTNIGALESSAIRPRPGKRYRVSAMAARVPKMTAVDAASAPRRGILRGGSRCAAELVLSCAHRGTPPFQGAEPYAIASVTLDEGVNLIADLIHCKEEDLKIGMRVKAYWHPLDNGEHLLMWQPDRDAK